MTDGVTVRTNLPDFKAQLKAFGFDMERKIFRAGVSAAAVIFRKKVEQTAPVRTGRLRRAVYIKRARDSKNGLEHYFVGVRQGRVARGRKGGNVDAFYWRFVELGHLIRRRGQRITGGSRSRALQRGRGGARVPARPFLAPAYQRGKNEALGAFNARVQARIDKENAKR